MVFTQTAAMDTSQGAAAPGEYLVSRLGLGLGFVVIRVRVRVRVSVSLR